MASTFAISDILHGSNSEKAVLLTSILGEVNAILKANTEWSGEVPYQVVKRKVDPYDKLLTYQGPDDVTVRLLEANCDAWLLRPSEFWDRAPRPDATFLDPQAQIVGCFLQTQINDEHACLPPEAIAQELYRTGVFGANTGEIKNTIIKMIDAGSRYRNLEKTVGGGAALVLGTGFAETSWARALPKKDEKFNTFITHLRNTSVPELALKYAALRTRVVDYKLNILVGGGTDAPGIRAESPDTSSTMDFVAAAVPGRVPDTSLASTVMYDHMYDGNYAFSTVLVDDPMLGMIDDWGTSGHATWYDLEARQGRA